MKNRNKKHESGQIIVLLAVSLVVVMVVAALAVDGGMIYSERRFAQNASDAASLAGGGSILYAELEEDTFTCPASSSGADNIIQKAYIAARNVAQVNNVNNLPFLGYRVDGVIKQNNGINENHGVVIDCYTNPKQIDVTTRITSQISTAFAHLLYPGDLATTNEAVVTVIPAKSKVFGNAIISLSQSCKSGNKGDGMFISGSATIKIKNGGTHTNSCLDVSGLGNNLIIDTEGDLNVFGDDVTLDGPQDKKDEVLANIQTGKGLVSLDPEPTKPTCPVYSTTTQWKNVPDYTNVSPGKYDSVSIKNGDTVVFTPGDYLFVKGLNIQGGDVTFGAGIYCIEGGITINGGQIFGNSVTFVVNSGSVDLVGGGNDQEIVLAAPTDPDDPNFGMLFYVDATLNDTFKISGNNDSYFSGQIYVPKSTIYIGGSSTDTTLACKQLPDSSQCVGVTFATQFIGNQVVISGDGNLDIYYNGEALPPEGSKMYLQK